MNLNYTDAVTHASIHASKDALQSSRGHIPGSSLPSWYPCCLLHPVNWHQLIDERNYEMDQVIISVLRKDPAKLELVVLWIQERLADSEYSARSKTALKEWLDLVQAGISA